MRYLKRAIYKFSIFFILLASLLAFLLTTTPGLYTSIKLVDLFLPGKLLIKNPAGHLINHVSFNELTYVNGNVTVQLEQGILNWHLITLFQQKLAVSLTTDKLVVRVKETAQFHIPTLQLPFNLQINHLTVNQLQVQLGDNNRYFNKIELQGSLNNNRWIIKSLNTHAANLKVSLTASGQSTTPYALSGMLQLTPLIPRSNSIQSDITFSGDSAQYDFQGVLNGPIHGNVRGTLKHGVELQTDVNWDDAKWPISALTMLKSSQGHVTINGTWSDLMINASTRIDTPISALWQITAHVKHALTDITSTLNLTDSQFKTTITAKGTLNNTQKGALTVTINPGTYQLAEGSPIKAIPFSGGTLTINLTPRDLQTKGLFIIDPQTTVNLALRLPKFRFNKGAPITSQSIDGTLSLQLKSLNFLQGYSKAVEGLQGQLQMNLTAKGSLAKPVIKGELSLINASFSLPKSGLTFSPINAKLQSSNNHWQAQGSVTASDHTLILNGKGDYSPQFSGQLKLTSDNFPVMKTANYTINVSPQLAINVNPTSINITGNVLVPSAQLKPLSFSNTVSLSDDVVFVNKATTTTTTANPFNINTDVQITMGKEVDLDVKGLRGYLDGAIHILQLPNRPMIATGELTIRDGKYQAYGQDLLIDQGQIMFTGGAIDNPGLHIRAIRKFSNTNADIVNTTPSFDFSAGHIDTLDVGGQTTVGIELNGHLNTHKLTLFSIPASLSQADILSLLILGKPASQASKSGGQLLLAAISSMNLDSGTKGLQLLTQMKQNLGVDFNLQNNTSYKQTTTQTGDNTALVVGKSLSKRLYLSYNVGLLQNDSNVLTLKYLLNRFFSIQVTTSDTGNGVDLLYTH